MENYKLYSTNLLLGGNMKYDLVLDTIVDEKTHKKITSIRDVHITPLAELTSYNKYIDENLMNYTHQENLARYYKNNIDSFYEDGIDTLLKSNWPIKTDKKEFVKNYDDTFIMGAKRSHYNIYKKQCEVLVPLWLEQVKKSLIIYIKLKDASKDYVMGSIKVPVIGGSFNYFKDYIKFIGLDTGDDKVMYIGLENKQASINCIDLESGQPKIKDVSYIVPNLLSRERPLLENDSIIINSWVGSIAKQLFNFNICFDYDDVTWNIVQTPNTKYYVSVSVEVDGKELLLKDFYTNYQDLIKEGGDAAKESDNVLSYLQDNHYLSFVDKNKIPQKYIHWSLQNHNNYIFNLYDGFAGVDEGIYLSHYYGLTKDSEEYKDLQLRTINFNKTVTPVKTEGPSINIKEIEYNKSDNKFNYIFRYDGRIKPSFVTPEYNVIYYKIILNKDNKGAFDKYINTGYIPLYPSIGYYSYGYCRNDDYKDLNKYPEYKLYNDNIIYLLQTEINFDIADDINETTIHAFFDRFNESDKEYIKTLYDISYDLYDNQLIGNKVLKKFHVKLTLK